ncbi:TetR/AcrR family transcriptional regulator [Brevibacterium aurantiacum]|uniref:TetR family transcriptional regulator n=1 Tax=Brevibacterium aurantiacum TaxID=273384 RepID=A0A2A3ZLJ1_BREAU|nr:TetR/AcrR family transcriptional regulator [Brevibacterium aurantiacum]PCC52384.1 TetR family transcriptional regulator [Brevibacterium aurantiacum]
MSKREYSNTRERILAAAADIIAEDGMTAKLSVRAIAARVGVSTGSLRHHFPTQQALRDEVMRRAYDWMLPDTDIHNSTLPARDRLVECLRQVLATARAGSEAREAMTAVSTAFIVADQNEQVRETYLAIQRDGQRRTEDWLRVLADEGGIPNRGDIPRFARFLCTVLDGIALERALPAEDSLAQLETQTLYVAADAVLGHHS